VNNLPPPGQSWIDLRFKPTTTPAEFREILTRYQPINPMLGRQFRVQVPTGQIPGALLALRQHPAIEDAETVMTVVEPTGVVTLQGLNEASPPRMMGAILLVGAVVGLLWLSGD